MIDETVKSRKPHRTRDLNRRSDIHTGRNRGASQPMRSGDDGEHQPAPDSAGTTQSETPATRTYGQTCARRILEPRN